MTRKFMGTSRLALIAEPLSARQRVGLALLAAELSLERLKSSPNYGTGLNAIELAKKWYDGKPVDPHLLEEALHDEEDEGVLNAEILSKTGHERTAWRVLASALYYIAWHSFLAAGQMPGALVTDVEEHELDELDEQLRKLFGELPRVLLNAPELGRQRSPRSFAELKSMISR
jgi:hypothetical protein